MRMTLFTGFSRQKHFVTISLCLVVMAGCSPFGLVDNSTFTANTLDPEVINTQRGVLALYNSSVKALAGVMAGSTKTPEGIDRGGIPSFVRWVGHVSDELDYRTSARAGFGYSAYTWLNLSTRNFDPTIISPTHDFFDRLSELRNFAAQTQTGLRLYGTLLSDTLLAHAMAIEATALIMTAELYCSGVPLSRLDFNGDIVLTRGYSTEEMFTFALAKLDSAGPYAIGNTRIVGLIDVLRIRALLGLGKIQEAAAIAQRVETSFQYRLTYSKVKPNTTSDTTFYDGKFTVASVMYGGNVDPAERISDYKGTNGLPYISSNDPRVTLPELSDSWAPFVMASGIEARLAEAEAALQRSDPSWLSILNALRTNCTTTDACPSPAPAGAGGVPGLGLLQDPGDPASKLSMLFEERAYWLFLRGFRQGDLRRRIRTYGGTVEELYPIGFPEVGTTAYGSMISLPVPFREQQLNSRYKGCLHNDA